MRSAVADMRSFARKFKNPELVRPNVSSTPPWRRGAACVPCATKRMPPRCWTTGAAKAPRRRSKSVALTATLRLCSSSCHLCNKGI